MWIRTLFDPRSGMEIFLDRINISDPQHFFESSHLPKLNNILATLKSRGRHTLKNTGILWIKMLRWLSMPDKPLVLADMVAESALVAPHVGRKVLREVYVPLWKREKDLATCFFCFHSFELPRPFFPPPLYAIYCRQCPFLGPKKGTLTFGPLQKLFCPSACRKNI